MKKNKVGRPKLADKELKKKSYIMLGISALLIMILLSGTLVSLNVMPKTNKLKGSTPIYKTYAQGDMFCLNGEEECFYTISDNGDTVTALAQYNVDTNTNRQNQLISKPTYNQGLEYNETIYIYDNYPVFVFGEESYLWQPLKNYEEYIKNDLNKLNIESTLLSYDQAVSLGCEPTVGDSCQNAPVWLKSTYYWLGSAGSNNSIYGMHDSLEYHGYCHYSKVCGLRPVITIAKSDFAKIIGYEPEPEPETTTTTTKKEETTTVATTAATNPATTTTKKKVVRKATTTTTTAENKIEETTTTTKVNNINKVVNTTKAEVKKEKSVPVIPIAVGGGAAAIAGIGYAIYLLKFKK